MGDRYYTRAEFDALADEQRRALELIANYRGRELEADDQAGPEVQDEVIQEVFGLFLPCQGCVPESEIGDDLCLTVREKFASIYGPAIELAEDVLRSEGHWVNTHLGMRPLIDASYEDLTNIVVIDWFPKQRPFCYLQESHKAWCYSFGALGELANEVLRIQQLLINNVRRLLSPANSSLAKAIQ